MTAPPSRPGSWVKPSSPSRTCSVDTCDRVAGCTHDLTPCCANAAACNDSNVCTDDTCDFQTGCSNAANTATCTDGDACTVGDACAGKVCVSGSAAVCVDGNLCTSDACVKATGCSYTPLTDGAPCDDGKLCTIGDGCKSGVCTPTGAKNCDDSNPCTNDTCDPTQGCQHTGFVGPCSDSNACTTGEACNLAGLCAGGTPTNCDDGNACTDDSCPTTSGCVHLANSGTCTDGSLCTTESCAASSCTVTLTTNCNDNDVCTTDACAAATGLCSNAPISCDDSNPCTVDACNPASGCTHASATDGTSCGGAKTCKTGVCQAAGMDVSGWKLVQANSTLTYTIPAGTTIPAGGYLLLARASTQAEFSTHWNVTLGANVVFLQSTPNVGTGTTGFPEINGSETYTLEKSDSSLVEGPTIAEVSSGAQSIQRSNPAGAAGVAASWTVAADSTATPGSGQTTGKVNGVYISEFSDASGSGNFYFEFVELFYDPGP